MDCCDKENKKIKGKGIFSGILYGLIPHTGCIAFIIFSVIGATAATAFFRRFLLIPYFFYILVGISFILATVSAIIYLKRNDILSVPGIKKKWKYLSALYGTTISVNLLFFLVIFPVVANLDLNSFKNAASIVDSQELSSITLEVSIPCSGHAPLITEELKKIKGVKNVEFKLPNIFDVSYDSLETSKEKILALEIFNTYQAIIVK